MDEVVAALVKRRRTAAAEGDPEADAGTGGSGSGQEARAVAALMDRLEKDTFGTIIADC